MSIWTGFPGESPASRFAIPSRSSRPYHLVYRQQRAMGRTVERRMLHSGELEVVIAG